MGLLAYVVLLWVVMPALLLGVGRLVTIYIPGSRRIAGVLAPGSAPPERQDDVTLNTGR